MEGYGLRINTVRKYMPDRVKSPGRNWKHGTQRAGYHIPLLGFQMKKNEQEESSQTQSQTADAALQSCFESQMEVFERWFNFFSPEWACCSKG
jgi:hypothetical protein